MAPLATNVDMWNRLLVCSIVYFRWPESSDGKNRSTFGKLQSRCLLQTYIWSNNVYNHKVRHGVGSILIIKYRSWCTLTFQKCVKKGKLCQNATLINLEKQSLYQWHISSMIIDLVCLFLFLFIHVNQQLY